MALLSQDQLVAKMGRVVSKNAISKYEKGQMMPDSKVLIALANALEVKTDFFYRSFDAVIDRIEFRKRKKLGKKEEQAIRAKVIYSLSRYIELESFLNIDSDFINPLADIIIKDKQDVENAAESLLKAWHLGTNALPNVIDMLEGKEIKLVELEAPRTFDGLSGIADERYPFIVINKKLGPERTRLTALHELAHLLLHFDESIPAGKVEKFCFQFAGAVLLPRETFKQEYGVNRTHISIKELISIKETYGISIQAIMARARVLELVSEASYTKFNRWISRNKTEEDLGRFTGTENSERFRQLLYRAAAEEIISMSKAANLAGQKLARFRKDFVVI